MEMTREQVASTREAFDKAFGGSVRDECLALCDSHEAFRARCEELEAELAVSIERDKLWQQAEAKVAELERERDRHRDDAGMYFRQAETADRQLGEARMRVEDERANRVEIAGREADAIQRIAALTSQLAAARAIVQAAKELTGMHGGDSVAEDVAYARLVDAVDAYNDSALAALAAGKDAKP